MYLQMELVAMFRLHLQREPHSLSPASVETSVSAVQETCDELAAKLRDPTLDRRQLLEIASELGSLVPPLRHLVAAATVSHGKRRDMCRAGDAVNLFSSHGFQF